MRLDVGLNQGALSVLSLRVSDLGFAIYYVRSGLSLGDMCDALLYFGHYTSFSFLVIIILDINGRAMRFEIFNYQKN